MDELFAMESFQDARTALASLSTPGDGFNPSREGLQPTTLGMPIDRALPSPSGLYIQVPQISMYAACIENAKLLGITSTRLEHATCGSDPIPSPFYRPLPEAWPNSHPRQLPDLKADLQPCELQLTRPHGLYIDTFPLPTFRERTLALLEVQPSMFDEAELIRDIDSGAFHCWGHAPWDSKSWEVEPWFLQKWWMLTGNEHGLVGKQSRWWREMRGEGETF